jgi:hypothetical protein
MSVNFSQAKRRQIPEDNPLHNHCRDSPKSNQKSDVGFQAPTTVVIKCTVACISVAREQLDKHIPAKTNSWPTIGKAFPLLGNEIVNT